MKKFIKLLIVFFSILLGLAYLMDYIITTGLKKTDLRLFQSWNDIYSSNIRSDAIIVGSSRAWCQYSPRILDSVLNISTYNIGIDGHAIDYQILKYNTYRRFTPSPPRYIIQNIDIFSPSITTGHYEREQFFPYISDDSLINQVSKIKNISFFDRYLPIFRYWGYRKYVEDGISSFFGKKIFFDGGMFKGYRGNNYKWGRKELDKIKSIQFSYELKADSVFEEYLSQAKREKIQIVFVYAPIYINGIKKIENLSEMYNYFKTKANQYNIPILNFTCDSISMDSSNFYNAIHLNRKGAELFSKKLAKNLDSLGIKIKLKGE